MVRLEYMDESDFEEYLKWSVKNYADEKVRAGTWEETEALEKSRSEFSRLLPDGRRTENNHLFRIMKDDGSEKIGVLWIGILHGNSDIGGAFIWDIMIYPQHRRKGYGRDTLVELDRKVKELGEKRVTLHVFGHNTAAIELYRSSGYMTTDLIMSKEIP